MCESCIVWRIIGSSIIRDVRANRIDGCRFIWRRLVGLRKECLEMGPMLTKAVVGFFCVTVWIVRNSWERKNRYPSLLCYDLGLAF